MADKPVVGGKTAGSEKPAQQMTWEEIKRSLEGISSDELLDVTLDGDADAVLCTMVKPLVVELRGQPAIHIRLFAEDRDLSHSDAVWTLIISGLLYEKECDRKQELKRKEDERDGR